MQEQERDEVRKLLYQSVKTSKKKSNSGSEKMLKDTLHFSLGLEREKTYRSTGGGGGVYREKLIYNNNN